MRKALQPVCHGFPHEKDKGTGDEQRHEIDDEGEMQHGGRPTNNSHAQRLGHMHRGMGRRALRSFVWSG